MITDVADENHQKDILTVATAAHRVEVALAPYELEQ